MSNLVGTDVSKAQAALLLTLAAAYDQRTIGEADVEAWHAAAVDHRWTANAARRVIRDHYGQGADRPRLEAPAITDQIRAIRRRAAASFEDPVIPDGQPTADYPEWYRGLRDAHCDALVQAWAETGQEPPACLPSAPRPNRLGQRRMAELTAGAFHAMPAAGRDGTPPTPDETQGRRSALAVACPYCSARPNQPCTRKGGSGRVRMKHPHPARGDRSTTEEAS